MNTMETQDHLLMANFSQLTSSLPAGSTRILLHYLEHRRLAAEEILWQEGDMGNPIAFILAGKLELLKATSFPGRPFVLGLFSAGSLVGEDSFMGEQSCQGTTRALVESEILILSRDRFEALSQEQPDLATLLLKWLMNLLSARLHNTQGRLAAIF
jgi:CRP-like cAMP-binding protein